jgi:UDP-3-O-acyl-N-acetylglucosamine deacetylase
LAGFGLHSGTPVEVRIHPGDQGIAFVLGGERIEARADLVVDTTRCTRLGPISTVEHLLSALAGLAVTDAEIEISAPEPPALDGGAHAFASALTSAGFLALAHREFEGPFARIFVREEGVEVTIARGEGRWRYRFDSGDRWPGEQMFEIALTPERYVAEIAPARTFAFEEEIEPLRTAGLGRGLDETTCLVLGANGYVNPPKFDDEPARHKMLDLIGDVALAGLPIFSLNVTASRSGHASNVRAAQRLREAVRWLN